MARKPVSYDALAIRDEEKQPESPAIEAPQPPQKESQLLRDVAAHIMVYIHPDAAKALATYAHRNKVRVHDLIIEALEDWFRKHGLREPVRAKSKEQTGRGRGVRR
jgi:cell pole-organizing protein PopZ